MTTKPLPPYLAPPLLALALAACSPTVKIEAPDKPIEINLNVRIEQEVRVKLERDVDSAIRNDPALFGLPPASVSKSEKGKTP
ncbi:YnbE family lipoprotein [Azospirillum doebereinerae]|uniref:YnbE family lipoprotein n=1 Tax=Azospirillum doebereinerae TaxID=92933 RepID=A0A3S0XNR7_9PROT|nr:YnbE family lipoprotein [Azospirillum doebereinerae]MCG5242100.1 YnbE family lipoprotein [Azospirillum doebereinerae]RUQ72950.1 YnbE family lipoprotein [Azospirillum doebereinerae]